MEPDDEDTPLCDWHGFHLNPFQIAAISAIRAGKNVLVSAPTGAGKTLVAEYAIESAVARGRRCIYTSPIKALSNQKYRDFRAQQVDVGLLTGDVTLQPRAQVLIMTTEILRNSIFENPRELDDVEFAIFDEVHFLDDPLRGTVWEESLIFAPERMRFLCLSATIPNVGELGAWLAEIRHHEIEVVESRTRPVPLHHRVFAPHKGIVEVAQLPKLARGLGPRPGAARRSGGRRGTDGRGRGRPRPPDAAPRTEALLDEICAARELPVLVFAFSRKDCERLARRNVDRDLLSAAERGRMESLQRELLTAFQLPESELQGELCRMGRRGIGYHHAGLLPIDKELVERMFTAGLLKMLFTTETFALGINMPARSVVFHSLEKFDGVAVDWLRCRDYMQMAGRAGRQGIDDEGLVYSALDERTLREAPLERILRGSPEPVISRFQLSYSTLLHLVPSLGRERVHEAWARSFNQFQHRAGTAKAQERNRRRQRALVEAHLAVLDELSYLEHDSELTGRGRIARSITGYELVVAELLFQGVLEPLGPEGLAVVFVALIHEERGRGGGPYVPASMYGNVRKHAARVVSRVAGIEAAHGLPHPTRLPDWGLTPAVMAWGRGASIEELLDLCESAAGDIVRVFRMAIQLMRQVRHAIDADWDLGDKLGRAIEVLNRGEVDARRQLELG